MSIATYSGSCWETMMTVSGCNEEEKVLASRTVSQVHKLSVKLVINRTQ